MPEMPDTPVEETREEKDPESPSKVKGKEKKSGLINTKGLEDLSTYFVVGAKNSSMHQL
jgi:hypothetical protein